MYILTIVQQGETGPRKNWGLLVAVAIECSHLPTTRVYKTQRQAHEFPSGSTDLLLVLPSVWQRFINECIFNECLVGPLTLMFAIDFIKYLTIFHAQKTIPTAFDIQISIHTCLGPLFNFVCENLYVDHENDTPSQSFCVKCNRVQCLTNIWRSLSNQCKSFAFTRAIHPQNYIEQAKQDLHLFLIRCHMYRKWVTLQT